MASDDHIVETPDPDELEAFMSKAGSVELIIIVAAEMRYTEVSDQIRVADSTWNIRREEAVNLGIIRGASKFDDSGNRTDYYELAPLGEALREKIRQLGLDRVYWRLLELEEQYEDGKDETVNWVTEDYDEVQERALLNRYKALEFRV